MLVSSYTLFSKDNRNELAKYSSPPPAFTISDDPTAKYIHMLFAIADPNLGLIVSTISPPVYRALECLEINWPAMLEDLSTGQINAELPLTLKQRRALQSYLRPDLHRVRQLKREFEKGFDGIAKRIWPHLVAFVGADVLGYMKKLRKIYGKGMCQQN